MSDVETRRAKNRESFPGVAGIVDEFKAAFGDDVKVLGGGERATGKSFGSGAPDGWAGCDGCHGRRPCDHPGRATVFCGFRKAAETAYVAGRWVDGGCVRLGGPR